MKKLLIVLLAIWAQNCLAQTKLQKLSIEIWKQGYAHLPFWNDTISHAGEQGYVDTFTINKAHFRIIHNDTLYDGILQTFIKDKWVNNIVFEIIGNHNDYDFSQDLDKDGNNDFIFCWKWYCEIHFFDKTINRFSDNVDCTVSESWPLIDSLKNIYYETNFGKLNHSPVDSKLFTFKNRKRIDFATLEIKFNANYDSEDVGNIKQCKLYKAGNKTPIESFKPTHPIYLSEYDVEKFWKSRIKKLLSNK